VERVSLGNVSVWNGSRAERRGCGYFQAEIENMSLLYQDSAIEPDPGVAEPASPSDLAARRLQNHSHHRPRLLRPDGAGASVVPLLHPHPIARHPAAHAPPRSERRARVREPGALPKRLLDILGSLTLGLVLSPVLLVVGLALLRDRGPIIYSHSRTGRHGRSFGCLKFRTMVPNAEQVLRDLLEQDPQLQREWMRDHKLRNDPRITTVGRFLRRTSLDELPQLWNVLKGEMSLVGPRPVVREEWQRYGRRLDTYLAAKPGVTGLWQVMGRSDSCYRRRVALDSYYVRKRSLLLDIVILLRTVKVVLRGRGAY
jgi:exopolysaccharide production protein ExoY